MNRPDMKTMIFTHLMTRLKYLSALVLIWLSVTTLRAQEGEGGYTPYRPTELPAAAPEWMAETLNLDQVNYHDMVARFRQYLIDHPDARRKTPMTKPIVNYFRRWQRAYAPYVTAEGRIRLPRQSDFSTMVAEVNAETPAPASSGLRAHVPGTEWRLISPLVTYDWKTKEVSPAQANIQRFGVAPSNPNVLYCGSETGMVFRSEDKGLHWTPATKNHYFGGEITTIEVSYTDPRKVIVGAGPILWLTTDGGDTWHNITPTSLRNVYRRVRDAVFHPQDDRIILMGNDAGMYRSTDSGGSWSQVNAGICFDIKYKPRDPSVVYALVRQSYGGLMMHKSTDSGQTYTPKALGNAPSLTSGRIGLSMAPTGGDYVYVWACQANTPNAYSAPFFSGAPVLLSSRDAAESWTVNRDVAQRLEPFDREGGQGYYDMVITASPKDPEMILFGLLNLYLSRDGGQTVENVGGYYGRFDLHCDMQDIQVVGDETWLSTDGGIIYSPDFFTTQAQARINGIYASEFWGFDMGWNEDVMVGGRNHNGNMSQLDRYNGVTISMRGSERSTGYVFLSNPRKIAYSDSENVIMPDDWRSEFVSFYGYWHYPMESTQFGMTFEFDPRYARSFYALMPDDNFTDRRSLWKTVDDGEAFVKVYTFPHQVSACAVSRANPDRIVVGTYTKVYQSLDGGKTFEEFTNLPAPLANSPSYKIAIHPRNELEIWIAPSEPGELYRTRDGGQSWESISQGLTFGQPGERYIAMRFFLTGNDKNAAYAIASISRKLNETYSTFRGRVLYRDDTTGGWVDYSAGLPPVLSINRMIPFYKAGVIRIATNNGIWERPLVDSEFRPVAQPVILNAGTGDNRGEAELQLDSYSIVNQTNATWQWQFAPTPLSVSSYTERAPRIRIAADQSYDVTLTVTTPGGTDTKTVRNMIVGSKAVPNSISGQEPLARDVVFERTAIRSGEDFCFTPRGLEQAVQLQLYDMSGRLVAEQHIDPAGQQTLAAAHLPVGTYAYHLHGGAFAKAGKLTIR